MLILSENIGIVTRGFQMTDSSLRTCLIYIIKKSRMRQQSILMLKHIAGLLTRDSQNDMNRWASKIMNGGGI